MIAYLDTPSGISGDMFLGCLVDAGWPLEALRETVRALNWTAAFDHEAWSVERREVSKGALRATRVVVQATEAGQPHRHLSDIRALLEGCRLPTPVIQDAVAVFTRLAEAEGAVHGESAEAVHFHEVGALDSIIDIVGVCAGMYALGLTELYGAALPMGPGFTWSQHGKIPLPAPATLELLAQRQAPIKAAPGPGELVTPTGAALVTHFVEDRWQQPEMQLHKVAIGAGKKDFEWPNVARLWIGESRHQSQKRVISNQARIDPPEHHHAPTTIKKGSALHTHKHDHTHLHPHTDSHDHTHSPHEVSTGAPDADQTAHATVQQSDKIKGGHERLMSLLETNIDDMNPEFYAVVAEKLFAQGARDVWWTPIQMKKNRPGVTLSVLATHDNEAALANILLRETTTLGIRVHRIGRYEAARRLEQVETPFGSIPVKLKIIDGETLGAMPEFEACKAAAKAYGVPTRQVYEAAAACAWEIFFM